VRFLCTFDLCLCEPRTRAAAVRLPVPRHCVAASDVVDVWSKGIACYVREHKQGGPRRTEMFEGVASSAFGEGKGARTRGAHAALRGEEGEGGHPPQKATSGGAGAAQCSV
jgi:hypothetical protein